MTEPKIDYCWQENTKEWIDELGYVFNNNKWTDCTICIQNEEEKAKFSCHKMILAKSSPVFERMLFGPLAETREEINIKDVSSTLFMHLLRFAYTGQLLPLQSVATWCQLLHIADMYMMKNLKESCSKKIQQCLTAKDACLAFELCTSDPRAMNTALLILQRETSKVLNHQIFLKAHQNTVLEIVTQNNLNIKSESELIWFVNKWAEHKCKVSKLEVTTENIRKVLGLIFQHLRFLTLTTDQFITCIDKTKILHAQEKYSVLKYIACEVMEFENDFPKMIEVRCRAAKPHALSVTQKLKESNIHLYLQQNYMSDTEFDGE